MATFEAVSTMVERGVKEAIRFFDACEVTSRTILFGLIVGYFTYFVAYGLFFCPTRHIPGPIITRFTAKYFHYLFFGGSISTIILELHKKYGSISALLVV